jgi:hypothetical protein
MATPLAKTKAPRKKIVAMVTKLAPVADLRRF